MTFIAGMTALVTEDDVRTAVRYFKAKGLFGDAVDEDRTVARILGHANTNSKEAVNEKPDVGGTVEEGQ